MSPTDPAPGENTLLELIAAMTTVRAGVTLGIGDDAAVLATDPPTVVTQDLLVDGVHFRRATASLQDIGYKAIAVNLSDLAAMGATPTAVFVGLALPDRDPLGSDDVAALYAGMEEMAVQFAVTIAGGDIVQAPALMLAITAIGSLPPGQRPVTRAGARPGDLLCVTGALGAATAGLAILDRQVPATTAHAAELVATTRRPTPRVADGASLAARGATAMMDCSDGLALDVQRLAVASGVQIELALDQVPIAPGVAGVAAALGATADEYAATGGDDYELIVTLPEVGVDAARSALTVPLTVVGRVVTGPVGLLVHRAGQPVALPRLGWEHRPGAPPAPSQTR